MKGKSPASRGKRSRFVIFLREGHRQARKDWCARWKHCILWLLAIIWFIGLVLGLLLLVLFIPMGYQWGSDACRPDGSFGLDPATYSYWSISSFFQITLGFGKLDFTQAKAIVIIWDVVISRGGQALIALISWRVFANYVTTSMEVAPVTFHTYRTVFMRNESLLVVIPRLVQDFTLRHGLHSTIAMVFMVVTMVFMLAFPTLGSAMAGYSGNVQAFVTAQDGQLALFEDFSFACYIINDGSRIGMEDGHVVTTPPFSGDPVSSSAWGGFCPALSPASSVEDCYTTQNVSEYIVKYNNSKPSNVSSVFRNFTLPPPLLNITAFCMPLRMDGPYGEATTTYAEANTRWAYNGTIYNSTYIQHEGTCETLPSYQWGFSFLQLFIMIILLKIWSIGIYVMWLRSHIIMKRRGREDVAGECKAVLELADTMRAQLQERGQEDAPKTTALTEFELRRRIAKDLRGGSISYKTLLVCDSFHLMYNQFVACYSFVYVQLVC